MRIIAIVGSTRRGNTYTMVEAGCHALQDCQVEFIHLKDLKIKFCDGCLNCDNTGKCKIRDDMTKVVTSMREADGFIFGTPTRWSLLSGELKTFFDRLNPMASKEEFNGKKCIIFAVGQTSSDKDKSIKLAVKSVEFFCNNAGIEVTDIVIAENCLEKDDVLTKKSKIIEKCKKAARKLHDLIIKDLE